MGSGMSTNGSNAKQTTMSGREKGRGRGRARASAVMIMKFLSFPLVWAGASVFSFSFPLIACRI
jgi:hypothetical protein